MTPDLNHDLQRFVAAQAAVYGQVLNELSQGSKTTHWMWFVFPQLKGLGRSAMAAYYGLADVDEAAAYGAHPLLGPRLKECTRSVLGLQDTTAHRIFGSPDDLKLRSCMTLFERAMPVESMFGDVLDRYFLGVRDPASIALLASTPFPRA